MVEFFYADDLNCKHTEAIVKQHLSTANTDSVFHPIGSKWTTCTNYTYTPHSNECGPRTLLALTGMGLHPTPHQNMLLLFMHPNLSQISRTWVAKTIISSNFNPAPFTPLMTEAQETLPYNSQVKPSAPANLIQWNFPSTGQHLSATKSSFQRSTKAILNTNLPKQKQNKPRVNNKTENDKKLPQSSQPPSSLNSQPDPPIAIQTNKEFLQ